MRIFAILPLCLLSACGATTLATFDQDIPATPFATQRTMAAVAGTPAPVTAPETSADAAFERILNNVRITGNAGTVSYDGRLDAAAQSYAEELLADNRLEHDGLNGSTPGSRATAAGYNWVTIGENIAQGYQTQEDVLEGWQGSSGHRANNLNPAFQDFGIGVAGDGSARRWVLVLGAE